MSGPKLPEKLEDESGQKQSEAEEEGQSKFKKSVQALIDSSKTRKGEQNKETTKGAKSDKENAKPTGNPKMLVTDPYREKFVDSTNQKLTNNSIGSAPEKENKLLSRLLKDQKDAEKKAQEAREAAKRRIGREKARAQRKETAKERMIMSMVPGLPPAEKEEKAGKNKNDGRPRLDITNAFEKERKYEEMKRIQTLLDYAAAKKGDKPKMNQVAPSQGKEVQPLSRQSATQYSQTEVQRKPSPPILVPVLKRKEVIPQNFVTASGRRLKLHEMDDFSGVFDVEELEMGKGKELVVKKSRTEALMMDVQEEKEKEKLEYNKLEKFNIPNRDKIMTTLLERDFYTHNFNGLIHQYYSYVLRSYCLMNMQDRYRGLDKNAPCLSLIDISKLNTKDTEQQRRHERALRCREENLQHLRAAARDSLHYRFLVEMTNNQSLTIPITIMYSILAETTPVVENVWRFYTSHLGKKHEFTRQAGIHFVRLERRLEMYDHLGLGNESISDY